MLHWTFLQLFVSKFNIMLLLYNPTSKIFRSKIPANFKLLSQIYNFFPKRLDPMPLPPILVRTETSGHTSPGAARAWGRRPFQPEAFILPMRSGCTFSSYNQPPVSLSLSGCVSAPCNRKSLTKHTSVPKRAAFCI